MQSFYRHNSYQVFKKPSVRKEPKMWVSRPPLNAVSEFDLCCYHIVIGVEFIWPHFGLVQASEQRYSSTYP